MDPRTDYNPFYSLEKEGGSKLDELEEVYVLVQMAVPKEGGRLIERVQDHIEPMDEIYRMCALVASYSVIDANDSNPTDYTIIFENASYYPD